jgi:hypothetical protein
VIVPLLSSVLALQTGLEVLANPTAPETAARPRLTLREISAALAAVASMLTR